MRDVTDQLRRYGDWVGEAVEAGPEVRRTPKRPKGGGRLLLAVAAVLVMLTGAAVLLTRAGDEDATRVDHPDDPRPLTRGDLVVESRHLIWALQDERAATAIHLIGQDPARFQAQPLGDARSRTDGAVDERREVFGDDEVGGLAALRSDADAVPVATVVENVDPVMGLVERYDALIAAILDTNDDYVELADDPGVELVASGLEADEMTARLSFLLLRQLTLGGGLDTSTELSEASLQLTGLRMLRSDVVDLADGSQYEDAARSLDQGLTEEGSLETFEAFLEAAPPPMTELLGSFTLPSGGLWRAFVEDVVADLDD